MNDDFFSLNLFHENDEEDEQDQAVVASPKGPQRSSQPLIQNFSEAIEFLSLPIQDTDNDDDDEATLTNYQNIISTYLGSMAQCRVYNKEIDRLGGIKYLMCILHTLIIRSCKRSPSPCWGNENEHEMELELANVTLGAVRDLACGNASNRLQIGQYVYEDEAAASHKSGIEIISYFVNIYAKQTWEQIPKLQLRNMTNALGVMRNMTHSTAYNSRALHEAGMTKVCINRIRGRFCLGVGGAACVSSLPDASKPWREASYRIAGTLINMAEKCNDTAIECAMDEDLILILIESWGGIKEEDLDSAKSKKKKAIPVLHLGLKAVLIEQLKLEEESAIPVGGDKVVDINSNGSPVQINATKRKLHSMIHRIMEREERRKRAAQERETSRKKS